MFTKKIRCDRCKENYDVGTLNAASVDHYKKCLPCCMATQTSYDPALLGVIAHQQRPPEDKTTMNERVFMVRIVSDGKRPIKDLCDHVANRVWSLDGVISATANEVK